MFQLVRRSDLPSPINCPNGRGPSEPRVHLNKKHKVISFSKLAAEVFDSRVYTLVEYDPDTQQIRLRAVDQLPPKVEFKHCFKMSYPQKRNGPGAYQHCSVAAGRLLNGLGLMAEVRTGTCEIVSLDKDRHTIIIRFPRLESPESPEPVGVASNGPVSLGPGPWQVDG